MRRLLAVLAVAAGGLALAAPGRAQTEHIRLSASTEPEGGGRLTSLDHMFAVSLFPPAQFPDRSARVSGFRLNLIHGRHLEVGGLDLGLWNHAENRMGGLGLGLMNSTGGDSYGLRLGLSNCTAGNANSLQISAWNHAGVLEDASWQLGLINTAGTTSGWQTGLINVAGSHRRGGIQIGILNWIDSGTSVKLMPIVNGTF